MDILAIGDYKVTNDDRIRLVHGYVSDWSLSIQPVNEEDAGEYICQINTEPQIISRINLEVLCKSPFLIYILYMGFICGVKIQILNFKKCHQRLLKKSLL
jgi:hypothetical protein